MLHNIFSQYSTLELIINAVAIFFIIVPMGFAIYEWYMKSSFVNTVVTLPAVLHNTSKQATFLYFSNRKYAFSFDSQRKLYLALGVYPAKRNALIASGQLYHGFYFSDIKKPSFSPPG